MTYVYDTFGRTQSMSYTNDDEVIESHTYTYDKTDKIAAERNVNSYTQVDELRSYTYDGNGQVLMFNISGSTDYFAIYTYDRVGNRIGKDCDEGYITYSYNSLNQLMEEYNQDTEEYVFYEYDTNGNQIYKINWDTDLWDNFSYTPSGMLEECITYEDLQENLYNGDGKRVVKIDGEGETRYYYQEGSVLRTTDEYGNAKSFNLLNVSDAFATSRENTLGDEYYFYTEDIRGSKVNIVDSDAAQVASYWYTDFGEVTETKGVSYEDFENELQYTGAIYDKLTRLLYLNARFYDPSNGRFITQDSYRGERTKPDTWHLYLYCANDPINYVDPTGHYVWKIKRNHFALILDTIASGLGLGVSFNALKVLIKKATKSKTYQKKVLIEGTEFLKKAHSKIKKSLPKVESVINRLWSKLGTGIKKIAKKVVNYGLDELNSNLFDALSKNLSALLSPGAFIAFSVDYTLHNKKPTGRLWPINLPEWTKKWIKVFKL